MLNIISNLAERHGISIAHSQATDYQVLVKGIPLWLACLKAEQYSPRTIKHYHYIVSNYLNYDTQPSFISIQHYLVKRLNEVSSSHVNSIRKALRSYFKFVNAIGLWPNDPTQKLKPIKVKYKEREIPKDEDIIRLLEESCYVKQHTDKFRLMVVLLLDTGLRINEACSILVDNIEFEDLAIKVIGKGGNERVVPISEYTGKLLKTWLSNSVGSK